MCQRIKLQGPFACERRIYRISAEHFELTGQQRYHVFQVKKSQLGTVAFMQNRQPDTNCINCADKTFLVGILLHSIIN